MTPQLLYHDLSAAAPYGPINKPMGAVGGERGASDLNPSSACIAASTIDCFPSHFRPFSPIIGSLKKTRDGQTDGRTDLFIEMRGRN